MEKNFYRRVLKNGMTLIFEKRNLPVVSVAFAVRAGGINEALFEKGISHFIEHMLYKGTPTRDAKKIAEEIEKNGGELNGFTDEMITAYWCKMPSKHLNVALEVLSDMVKNPLFDEKELEKERRVIFEEIKMRKDSPMIYSVDKIHEILYEKPFGTPLIGNEKSLKSVSRKDILKKFHEIYSPENIILSVVGDADFEKIAEFAEKTFGKEKGKIENFKIQKKNENILEKRKGIDQASLIFCYHALLATEEKYLASLVLSTLMAGGMSSRLFSEIREKRNLAYAVKGESEINNKFSNSFVYVGTTAENVELVKEVILKEFEKVSENLDAKELAQVKGQLIGNYEIQMEDSQVQMLNLLNYEINGNAEEYYNFERKIKEINVEDVKSLAKQALKKNSFFVLVPE